MTLLGSDFYVLYFSQLEACEEVLYPCIVGYSISDYHKKVSKVGSLSMYSSEQK